MTEEKVRKTPQEIEALKTAAEARAVIRSTRKALLAERTSLHKLCFMYIREFDNTIEIMDADSEDPIIVHGVSRTGGMVLAYQPPIKGGNILTLSTSVCSSKDAFDKFEGKFRAAENFDRGHRIQIVVTRGPNYSQQLRAMFCD